MLYIIFLLSVKLECIIIHINTILRFHFRRATLGLRILDHHSLEYLIEKNKKIWIVLFYHSLNDYVSIILLLSPGVSVLPYKLNQSCLPGKIMFYTTIDLSVEA